MSLTEFNTSLEPYFRWFDSLDDGSFKGAMKQSFAFGAFLLSWTIICFPLTLLASLVSMELATLVNLIGLMYAFVVHYIAYRYKFKWKH